MPAVVPSPGVEPLMVTPSGLTVESLTVPAATPSRVTTPWAWLVVSVLASRAVAAMG